jgi:hypothetical protein
MKSTKSSPRLSKKEHARYVAQELLLEAIRGNTAAMSAIIDALEGPLSGGPAPSPIFALVRKSQDIRETVRSIESLYQRY